MDPHNTNIPPQQPQEQKDIQDHFVSFDTRVKNALYEFNQWRTPRANALLIVGVIFLGGFMMYNFIGNQLTQVASESYEPAMATPRPSQSVPTTTLTPTP